VSRRLGARSIAFPRRPVVSPALPTAPVVAALHGRAREGATAHPLRRGAVMLAAATLLGAPALAACASGNDAMTNLARTTTNTANGAVGTINLRNVYVAGPVSQGGDAQVISALFNGGSQDDSLVAISSPDATGGTPGSPATLPPAGSQIYIANGSAPTLTGLKKSLAIGTATKVTFTFAKAGAVTLDVPVEAPLPGASAAPSVTAAAATPTATPTATGTALGGGTPTAGATATSGLVPTAAPTVTATP
jgi:copper(I)-binding protein